MLTIHDERMRGKLQRAVVTALVGACRSEHVIVIPAAEAIHALLNVVATLAAPAVENRTRRDRRLFGESAGRELARRVEAAQQASAADGAPFRTIWDRDGGLSC